MAKYTTFGKRILLGKIVFPVCLLLLVNSWIDHSFYTFYPPSIAASSLQQNFDDYDTFYEWLADTWCSVEDAIPEGDAPDEKPDFKKPYKNILAHLCFISKLPNPVSKETVNIWSFGTPLVFGVIDVPEYPPAV